MKERIKNNVYPFLIYFISLCFYLLGLFFSNDYMGICFFAVFSVLYIKLGYSKRIKDIYIGLIMFELQMLVFPVLYMIYMIGEMVLISELSILSLGNVIYSFYKPFTRIFTTDNYNLPVGIADLILSMLLPIALFYTGRLIKNFTANRHYGK